MTATVGTRVVFLDLDSVQARHNVVQRVCEATKHPDNPVLPLGDVHEWDATQARPWETRTVIYDEEDRVFKCWYAGSDLSTERWWATGYAISEDGVNWIKPRLGLFEYNGSKDNNICFPAKGSLIKDTAEEDPNKRYKAILKGPTQEDGCRAAYSPDGIHWTNGTRVDVTEGPIVVLLRDDQDPDPRRRYKLVWQCRTAASKAGPERVRAKGIAFGPDVEHFTASAANPIISPNDGLEQENHFLMLSPYRGQYVMLYEYGWYLPDGMGNYGSYSADIRLAASRDGEHFQRVQPHQKVIARGRRGEWDGRFLVTSDKPVIRDDKIYLYYCGQGEDWTSWPPGNITPASRLRNTGAVRVSRMGLATLRLDGFTCLETGDRETPGWIATKPIELTEKDVNLVINVGDAQQNRSWVEVEVLDADQDAVLPGFAREDCVDVCRDGLDVPVRWRNAALHDLDRSRVSLRFHLCGAARLFSFGFDQA